MYYSTAHQVGQTVYQFDGDEDCLTRGVVKQITIRQGADSTAVEYVIEVKTCDGPQLMVCTDEQLHDDPTSAFYRNPVVAQQAELLAA